MLLAAVMALGMNHGLGDWRVRPHSAIASWPGLPIGEQFSSLLVGQRDRPCGLLSVMGRRPKSNQQLGIRGAQTAQGDQLLHPIGRDAKFDTDGV